ncbi:MAG: GNAT family N-acetyltransferase [Phycisphaerales bacterium]|nr:GNAT family N-acetyltransferase [Phycisphaerales bacterium]
MHEYLIETLPLDHPDRGFAMYMALSPPAGDDQPVPCCKPPPDNGSAALPLLDPLVVARGQPGRIIAACAAVVSPGRAAMVFCGGDRSALLDSTLAGNLCGELQRLSWARGVVLLQSNTAHDDTVVPVALEAGGFSAIARLAYLECDVFDRKPVFRRARGVTCETYSPERDRDFVEALRGTYRASLDCPALIDLRDVGDALLGHRYTGVHDPETWFVALRDKRPVGVLLVSGVVARPCLEIVYVGVVEGERGRGLGDWLMALAVETGRKRGLRHLLLAVDEKNHFARSMYDRWGFAETARRDVWIVTNRSA